MTEAVRWPEVMQAAASSLAFLAVATPWIVNFLRRESMRTRLLKHQGDGDARLKYPFEHINIGKRVDVLGKAVDNVEVTIYSYQGIIDAPVGFTSNYQFVPPGQHVYNFYSEDAIVVRYFDGSVLQSVLVSRVGNLAAQDHKKFKDLVEASRNVNRWIGR